jgi:hypothetical protein
MNEIINAKGNRYQSGYNAYSALKKKWSGIISHAARNQHFEKVEWGHFSYYFLEPNRRRDPSNFASGGIKLIEDALQDCDLLSGDGWKNIRSVTPFWDVDKDNPGVMLVVDTLYYPRRTIESLVRKLLEGENGNV